MLDLLALLKVTFLGYSKGKLQEGNAVGEEYMGYKVSEDGEWIGRIGYGY
jgi:hypothetical protein